VWRDEFTGQASYWNELRLKNRFNPELGPAGVGDLVRRGVSNLTILTRSTAKLMLNVPSQRSDIAWLGVPFVIACLWGFLLSLWRECQIFDVYVMLYIGLLLVWPVDDGSRFLLPIAPFLFYYVYVGIQSLRSVFPIQWWALIRRILTGAVWVRIAVGLIIVAGYVWIEHTPAYYVKRGASAELLTRVPVVVGATTGRFAEWLLNHTSGHETIMCRNADIMHAITGLRSIAIPRPFSARALSQSLSIVDYLLIGPEESPEVFVVASRLPNLSRVYASAGREVYRVQHHSDGRDEK
jgi:hypothetical protein